MNTAIIDMPRSTSARPPLKAARPWSKVVILFITLALFAVAANAVEEQDSTPAGSPRGPEDLQGLRKVVGRINAVSGQVIENINVSNPDGPCIVVLPGASNVVIRNSRIGPCGPTSKFNDYGILILAGAKEISIIGNVIHDVGSGIKAGLSINPIVIEDNYIYNIRGPHYNGQAVQFNGVAGGNRASRINCNISDANFGSGAKGYGDHISMYKSSGTAEHPIEIAYNRIRGGSSKAGSGITVGDLGGGWIQVHDNTVVAVANNGIAVAGGHDISVDNNRVDNRGDSPESMTYQAFVVRGQSSCSNITIRNNRGIARLWNWRENKGDMVPGYRHGPETCTHIDEADNQFGDLTLSAAIFEEIAPSCRRYVTKSSPR